MYANDDIENLQQFMEMQRKMIIAQLIYYFGIAVSTSYLTVSLRNHFMSNLSLNDGRISFGFNFNIPRYALSHVCVGSDIRDYGRSGLSTAENMDD